jgi:hypothetical protein
LGEIALASGQRAAAAAHFREGVIQGWDGDYPLGIAWNLIGLVRLARFDCQLASAARLVGGLGAFSGLMQALPLAAVTSYEADVARVQTSLGQQDFTAMREAGRVSPLEDIVAEGITLADELLSGAR